MRKNLACRRCSFPQIVSAVVLLSVAGLARAQQDGRASAIQLSVDARDAPRKVLHARLVIPVTPGPLTLVYPKWIPGCHEPAGPVVDLVGLKLAAAGRPVAWQRDEVDLYAFRCEIPSGASELVVEFDCLVNAGLPGGSPAGLSRSDKLAVINWNEVLVYPAGASPLSLCASIPERTIRRNRTAAPAPARARWPRSR